MRNDTNIASFDVVAHKDIAALTLPEKMYQYLQLFI